MLSLHDAPALRERSALFNAIMYGQGAPPRAERERYGDSALNLEAARRRCWMVGSRLDFPGSRRRSDYVK